MLKCPPPRGGEEPPVGGVRNRGVSTDPQNLPARGSAQSKSALYKGDDRGRAQSKIALYNGDARGRAKA